MDIVIMAVAVGCVLGGIDFGKWLYARHQRHEADPVELIVGRVAGERVCVALSRDGETWIYVMDVAGMADLFLGRLCRDVAVSDTGLDMRDARAIYSAMGKFFETEQACEIPAWYNSR